MNAAVSAFAGRASAEVVAPTPSRSRSPSQPGARPAAHALARLPILARLEVSSPDDPLEQEADAVADRIVAEAEGPVPVESIVPVEGEVTEEEEEEEAEKTVLRDCGCGATCGDCVDEKISPVLRSPGEPLADDVRARMEPRFGRDFSAVRIHRDGAAAESAHAIGAHAYTVGADVVFGAGRYAPGTPAGTRLLAHELAHVAQAGNGGSVNVRRYGANPGCMPAEGASIHVGVDDATAWCNKAIPVLEASPLTAPAVTSLSNNFGPTHGVAANAGTIAGRLRTARTALATIPIGCKGATDAICNRTPPPCGFSYAGSHATTICRNATFPAGRAVDPVYRAGCVLHETMHATFAAFTGDSYSGWHGHSGSSAGYPGATPLTNADSYTTTALDLS